MGSYHLVQLGTDRYMLCAQIIVIDSGELAARLQEVENLAAEEAQLQLQQQQQQSMSQQVFFLFGVAKSF